jgi:hypothetical protein
MNDTSNRELEQLETILDFSARMLEKQNIDLKKIRKKKQLFLLMHIALHNISESIFCLCKEERTNSCFILLRTLFENHVNAKFLFCSSNLKNFHSLQGDVYREKTKQLENAWRFVESNPNHSLTPEQVIELNLSINENKKCLDKVNALIDKYPGEVPSNLFGRAEFVDKYNEQRNKKTASLVWRYHLIYRELSTHTHLKISALRNFLEQSPNEAPAAFLSGNPSNLNIVATLTNDSLKEFVSMFMKIFNSPLKSEYSNLKLKYFNS